MTFKPHFSGSESIHAVMVYTGIYCTECTNSLIMFLTRKAMSQFNFFEILMNRR